LLLIKYVVEKEIKKIIIKKKQKGEVEKKENN
jgi:hypothetical protein